MVKGTKETDGRKNSMKQQLERRKLFFPLSIIVFMIIIYIIGLFYQLIINHYQQNLAKETAAHLSEINNQMKIYTEEEIEKGWKIARSAANDLESYYYFGISEDMTHDDKVLKSLRNKQEVWKVSDIAIYTENGYCICVSGNVEMNDTASVTIMRARESGTYMAIVDSNITYTIPVKTDVTYRGSKVVAISVIQNLSDYLDNMDLSSYNGHAEIYLTDEEGVVISRLNNEEASYAYNIMSLINKQNLSKPINTEQDNADIFEVTASTVYLMTEPEQEHYIVSTPIKTHSKNMHLFYLIPGNIVNQTMDSFTTNITLISVAIIVIFIVFFAMIYYYIYKLRKREFDKALITREHMFELLVRNAKTAFGLFKTGKSKPSYISSNTNKIIGEEYLTLHFGSDGYYMQNEKGECSLAIKMMNERLKTWDGKSVFSSGYIEKDDTDIKSYYEIQLYPTEESANEFVGIAQDVTEAFDRENATREALAMAERANEAKTRFLSNMSHDIRTPMNAIVNMTGFAMESMSNEEKLSGYLRTISESAAHLLMLINDILDMSRIESGKSVMEKKPFSIKNELIHLEDIVKPLCDQKKQTLDTNFAGVSVSGVVGDHSKVSQILMNLLSNAVKYTQEGGTIKFTAKEIPSLQENVINIRFIIADNGMGISNDFLEHIFEPFSREDESRVGRIQGTGLGLSICHSYVIAMGGTITCESEEEQGSTFTVELFFERTDAVLETSEVVDDWNPLQFSGSRCLLCEDNVINQMIAQTMLERLGFTVDIVSDGKEGIDRFNQSKEGYYDVIFMDIQMPIMNGYATTDAIRKGAHPQATDIPIIAMTANVFAEDIEKARVVGMSGFIAKPFDIKDIYIETMKVIK